MALIYADDFQQMKYMYDSLGGNGQPALSYANTQDGLEAMGYYRPFTYQFLNGQQYQYYVSAGYWPAAVSRSCMVVHSMGAFNFGNTSKIGSGDFNGLRRALPVPKGDTLFFNFKWSMAPGYWATRMGATGEPFVKLGPYALAFSPNKTLLFNGVDTGYLALYDIEIPLITEIILGPTFAELWVGGELVTSQPRQPIPVSFFHFGFENFDGIKSSQDPGWNINIYGIIIADNSPGNISSRIGRKLVKTYEMNAVTATTATTEAGTITPLLDALRRPAQDMTANAGSVVGGNIYSPKPYTKTTFTGAKEAANQPIGAMMHVQAKRRSPSGDGMLLFPWIKVGGVEIPSAKGQVMRSRWLARCSPIEIPTNASFTTFDFGYYYDYDLTASKVFVDDRTKVEVYGDNAAPPFVPSLPFQSAIPTTANLALQTATYSAYVFDYAKSDLNVANAPINNLTYYQDV